MLFTKPECCDFTTVGDLQVELASWSLPQLGSVRLCQWGGADLSGAEGAIQQGQQWSVGALQQAAREATGYLAPWRQMGSGATGVLGGLYNLPGYAAIDPTKQLEATPGYKWLQSQGMQALANYGSATGLGLSGPASKSAQSYGQNLALNSAWLPYINELNFMSGQGLTASGESGQFALQAAGQEANTTMQGSLALANLQRQQALYDQQAQNSMWNDIATGAGFILGGPLGGAIGSGVSGLFGGGAAPGYSGPMSGMPGMNMDQMYNVGSNSNYAFQPSSGGGWIPAMADGGQLGGGQPALVGERGPELFVPRTSGYIVPNYALPQSAPQLPQQRSAAPDQYSAFAPWRMAA